MLDVFISALLAAVTIAMAYLGVHVTLHPPGESLRTQRRYKVAFCACGVIAVSLVVVQGIRTNKALQRSTAQITNLENDIQGAKTEAQNARAEASNARTEVQKESARRQQAEKDLEIIVQSTGKATRQGVAEDIKKNPLKVSVNGAGGHTEEERKKREAVRVQLGYLMSEGRSLMSMCISPPRPPPNFNFSFSCERVTADWQMKCARYIMENMDASYFHRFGSATGLGMTWPVDQKTNNILQRMRDQTDILEKFIQELLD